MKVNLIGMILNNMGRATFDGLVIDDNGKPMPAADSLHTLIMEYAKVATGGTSDVVTTSSEVNKRTCGACKHKNTDQRHPPCMDCFAVASWVERHERPNTAVVRRP